jgi:hypothetical protein
LGKSREPLIALMKTDDADGEEENKPRMTRIRRMGKRGKKKLGIS